MRKSTIVFIICFLLLAHCQKKEESKVQTPFSPVHIQEEKMKLLQEAVKRDPTNVTGWVELGNFLMDISRYHEAIDAYHKALEREPTNVDVRVDMGTCYRRIGRSEVAAEEFRKAIKINPSHPYAHRNLGVVLAYDFKDTKQAIKEFEEYLILSPNTPDSQQIKKLIAKLKSAQ